jgi:hypothetical protein
MPITEEKIKEVAEVLDLLAAGLHKTKTTDADKKIAELENALEWAHRANRIVFKRLMQRKHPMGIEGIEFVAQFNNVTDTAELREWQAAISYYENERKANNAKT